MSPFSAFDKKLHFLDKGNTVDIVSLDFRNAFDRGPHSKSLVKMEISERNV